ncbi:MAG: class I SAM-dependent methyltransferase [Actinobacteria bacterium]|nr:class I SAM-dependent methyltransferase [Actinomycetota bacterium]
MEASIPSWRSQSFVAEWAGEDVLADMLALPRRISAALVADSGSPTHVIDVGSGPGDYLRVFLEAFPYARGTWTDTSPPMEPLGREGLADLGERVTYRLGDAEELAGIGLEPADVIVTSRMLHHFRAESLQRFYRDAFALLAPGGFLFNLDHFGSPPGWETRYRRIRGQFTGARTKELANHRHEDTMLPLAENLAWIEAAGFEPPDTPWRTFFTALVAAQKPA